MTLAATTWISERDASPPPSRPEPPRRRQQPRHKVPEEPGDALADEPLHRRFSGHESGATHLCHVRYRVGERLDVEQRRLLDTRGYQLAQRAADHHCIGLLLLVQGPLAGHPSPSHQDHEWTAGTTPLIEIHCHANLGIGHFRAQSPVLKPCFLDQGRETLRISAKTHGPPGSRRATSMQRATSAKLKVSGPNSRVLLNATHCIRRKVEDTGIDTPSRAEPANGRYALKWIRIRKEEPR